MRTTFGAACLLLGCGARSPEPVSAERVASLPLLSLLPEGCFGVLRVDLRRVPASTEPSADADKMPFVVSEDLEEVVMGFVSGGDGARGVVLLRGDLDGDALRRETEAAADFAGWDRRPRVWRRHGHDRVRLWDQLLVDLGGGTWIWTDDDVLAESVERIANGRRPPSKLLPRVRETADVARLEESVFALALVTDAGVREGLREAGDALGGDAGTRLADALQAVAVSVLEDEPDGFRWEIDASARDAEAARTIAAVVAEAGEVAAALAAAVGVDLGGLGTTSAVQGSRFVLRGHMTAWTNRLEWSRPPREEPAPAFPRNPRQI